MRNDSNNRDTDIFADIGGLEPSDFYSERRESAPAGDDFMKVLNDRPVAPARRAPTAPARERDDDILNSFHIAADTPATKRIFAEVDEFDSRRRGRDASLADGAITDEILRVDLPDDDTFVEDVVDSYRTAEAHDLTDAPEALFSVRIDEDADFAAPQTRRVEPNPSIHVDFDAEPTQEQRFESLSAALQNASENQSEIHKSIQIVLEDVKRHQDQDEELTAAVRRATRPVGDEAPASIPTLFVSEHKPAPATARVPTAAVEPLPPRPTVVIEQRPEQPTVIVESAPAEPTVVIEQQPTARIERTQPARTSAFADPAPYAANFKRPADDFFFQDNTARSRRPLNDAPTGPVLRTEPVAEDEAAPPPVSRTRTVSVASEGRERTQELPAKEISTRELRTQEIPVARTARVPETEAQTQAIRLNGAVLEELRRYANEAVRQQMDVELAKLEGQRAQLEAIQKQQEALDQLREREEQNLSVNLDAIRGADELESSRAALDEERERFREERRKMADEFFELSQRERESLAAERERVLGEAQAQREKMMAEAQREIDRERERLQREIEAQREMLLEVAEREKERLLDAAQLAKTQYVADADVEVTEELPPRAQPPQSVQSAVASQQRESALIDELRGLMDEIRGLKAADEAKFEQLRSELSEEARNAVSEAISASPVAEVADKIERISYEQKENFEQLSDKIDAAAALPPDYSEMLPQQEDRSYTERVIDDLEDDDARSEAAFLPQPPVQYEQPRYYTQPIPPQPVAPEYAPAPQAEADAGVDTLRETMRAPRDVDFEFDEKRLAYERDRVKEEIKREVLTEMGRLTGEAVRFSSSVTAQVGGHEDDGQQPRPAPSAASGPVMTGSSAVPELAAGRAAASVRDATRLYDFDLFDELGIEAFEADDPAHQRTRTVKVDPSPQPEPAPEPAPQPAPTAEVPPPAFGAPLFTPAPLDLPPPEADKFKGRNAHLLLNHKYDNLSSADLIKSYARDLRRRLDQKKK